MNDRTFSFSARATEADALNVLCYADLCESFFLSSSLFRVGIYSSGENAYVCAHDGSLNETREEKQTSISILHAEQMCVSSCHFDSIQNLNCNLALGFEMNNRKVDVEEKPFKHARHSVQCALIAYRRIWCEWND